MHEGETFQESSCIFFLHNFFCQNFGFENSECDLMNVYVSNEKWRFNILNSAYLSADYRKRHEAASRETSGIQKADGAG